MRRRLRVPGPPLPSSSSRTRWSPVRSSLTWGARSSLALCFAGVISYVKYFRHEVRWDTLDKFPTSRLGRLRHCVTHRGELGREIKQFYFRFVNNNSSEQGMRRTIKRWPRDKILLFCSGLKELCDAYSLQKREYYFDRSPRNFDSILGLYRTNKLHLSQGVSGPLEHRYWPAGQVCVQDFCEELEYWGLNDLHLEPCCQHTYYRARWLLPRNNTLVSLTSREGLKVRIKCNTIYHGQCQGNIPFTCWNMNHWTNQLATIRHDEWPIYHRRRWRKILERVSSPRHRNTSGICLRILITPVRQRYISPEVGVPGIVEFLQVIAVVSCLFVVVSTLCLIFSTLPRFQKKDKNGVIRRFTIIITITNLIIFL